MFQLKFLAALGLLASSVTAAPGGLFERAPACNADYCLRAVRAAQSAAAYKVDCDNNLKLTVVPCAITSTKTSSTTLTSFETTPSTQVISQTDTSTSFTTIPTTVVVTQTSVSIRRTVTVLTSTAGDPVTATTVVYAKRIAPVQASCSAVTLSPSSIPSYASTCGSAARYTSACSCVGASAAKTTLNPETTWTTVTKTFYETQTGVSTAFETRTTETVVVGTTYSATTSATLEVTTSLSLLTYVISVRPTTTTTTTSSRAPCSTFVLKATSGPNYALWVGGNSRLEFRSDRTYAKPLVLKNGNLFDPDVPTKGVHSSDYNNGGNANVWLDTNYNISMYPNEKLLTCSVTQPVPAEGGPISCSLPSGKNVFSKNYSDDFVAFDIQGRSPSQELNLIAIPACSA